MASAAEYATGHASVAADEHDHGPAKPKALSRDADDIIDGGKPFQIRSNLIGTIESTQATQGVTRLLIGYVRQLEQARRVARDPSFDPIKPGMTGVINGTDLWFVVTHAAGGHAAAEVQGRHAIRSLQGVTVNPDDMTLARIHSHRPKAHANESLP